MDKYKNEAAKRFGNTDAYKEFEQRTKGYTEVQFECSAEGLNKIFKKFSECKAQGDNPDSAKVQALVNELKAFITQNFYTCTDEILRGLGTMYSADSRFKENIDKNGSGTTEFVSKAIEIYTKD